MRKQRGTKWDSKYVFLSIVNRLAFHPHFHESWKRTLPQSTKGYLFILISILRSTYLNRSRNRISSNSSIFFPPNDKERGERNGFDYQRIKVVSISSTFQLTREFLLSAIIRHLSNYESRLEQRRNSVRNYFILQLVYPRGT